MKAYQTIIFALSLSWPIQAEPWKKVSSEAGVEVFTKKVEGSDLFAFKGIKTMDVPLSKVAFVLLNEDIEQKKRWINGVHQFKFITYTEQNQQKRGITYTSYKLPFPFSDRDYVIDNIISYDKEKNHLIVDMKSVNHKDYPKDASVGIRALINHSRFVLEPTDQGQGTKVTVEIQGDLQGLVPDWLVNVINRYWPRNTLNSLHAEAKKTTQDDPFVMKHRDETAVNVAH